MNKNFSDNTLDEAGGIIDRKILSKIGRKHSKKSAENRILDTDRGEKLWDAYIQVTRGDGKYDLRELVSWLKKEVSIDGVKIDDSIITSAISEHPELSSVNIKSILKAISPLVPKKKSDAAPVAAPAGAAAGGPAQGLANSLQHPADTADTADWRAWADSLATNNPALFTKMARAMGAKIQSRRKAI